MIIIKKFTVCFSGHRKIPLNERTFLVQRLEEVIYQLIQKGYISFATGGAIGFDTLAAQTVLKCKQTHPDIKLILVLPCLTQAKYWSDADKAIYDDILHRADQVQYASDEYNKSCMYERNRQLVDMSSVCICYLKAKTGGTAYTVKYARESGIKTLNIAEK